jgi:nucleotide-binding universal stress UspA family protein
MFKRILVPVDGSETSTKALVMATQLAREGGGRIRLLHSFDALVFLSGFEIGPGVLEAAREYADKVLDDAMEIARAAGVPADKRLEDLPGGRLGEIVADAAASWEADLVVVGTHGRRGVGRVLLGSGAEQVIRLSPVPVLSVRGTPTKVTD